MYIMSDINENNELGYTDNEDNYSDFESTRTITSVIDTETGEEITVTDEFFKQDEARLILLRRRQHEAAYLDIGTPKYICSFCKKPVVLLGRKTNRGRVCFFAHFKDSDDCPIKTKMNLSKREIEAFKYKGQTESERHKELKGFLVNALEFSTYRGNPFVNIQEEKYIKSESPFFTWARPDVYSETGDKRINFEIQLSTTFLSVLITRDIFYRYHNIFILWIFNFDENQAYMDESSLMTKDIFYGNNGNMFILDETAKKLTEKNKELTFLCKWIEPEQKNGKNQNVVKNQYISISELTFDEKTHTVYFFDSISAIGKYDSTIFQIRKEIESGRLEFIDLLRSYMDGEIPTQEEVIERVKEGIYNPVWLKKGNKYGWAKFGHIIIPFIYTDARPFTNGYATVRRNRLYGIVDILGNEIVPCEYREIGTFVRGKAKVKKNGKYGYINENGEIIIPFEYDDIGKFVDGKAKTMQLYYGHCKYGYISENGTIIAPVKYDEISEFENGKAKVKIYRSCKHYQYGYINEKGLEIIPPYYNEIEEFVDGIAKAQRNGHGGRVDDKGNEIVENEIQITNQLIKGETFGEWGIRDLNGKIIVPYEYDEINDFIDGRAKAKKYNKYGYINENGEIIIPIEYDEIGEFVNKRAKVKKDGKYGYIDEQRNILIPCDYSYIYNFANGIAKVIKDGKYGYIDEQGSIIVSCDYQGRRIKNFKIG
jgi:hypothetical protein